MVNHNTFLSSGGFALARLLLAIAAGITAIGVVFIGEEQRFDELALGAENVAIFGAYGGDLVHCSMVTTAGDCLAPAAGRNHDRMVIWFGNSQLHAINQPIPGARTAPVMLAERLRPEGVEVLAFSHPNASLQEHRLLFEYLIAQRSHPTTLVLAVVLDDLREDQLRGEMLVAFDDPDVRQGLMGTALGHRLTEAEALDARGGEAPEQTLQDRVEASLEDALTAHLPVWAARPQARGLIGAQVRQVRNWVFGISSTSKRPMIPVAYDRNMRALEGLLGRAQEVGTNVIVYIAPLRNDVEPPYIDAEYSDFKDDVEALSAAYAADFINLENLVPAEHWGTIDTTTIGGGQRIDFMHFQFAGHVLLEEAIARRLEPIEQ